MSERNSVYFCPDIGPPSAPREIPLTDIDLKKGVLIRSTNWLGDAIMTLPGVYKMVKLLPPDATATILCPRKLETFWSAVPWVNHVIAFDEKKLEPAVREKVEAAKAGLTVVLPNSFGSAWHLKKAHAGPLFGRAGRFRGPLLSYSIPPYHRKAGADKYHQARHYLEMAACLGPIAWNCEFEPMEAELAKERAESLLPFPENAPLLVIAPGAAYGPAKQWPADSFRAVAEWWSETVGPVVSTGAPNESEVGDKVVDGLKHSVNLAGKTDLYELIYVIGRARCVLANDSGTMHLGAAMQKDGVALFGSTDPVATGPVGGRWVIKESELPCRPCLKRECPLPEGRYKCLTDISVQSVIDSLETFIA